jgi:hypothetical protein
MKRPVKSDFEASVTEGGVAPVPPSLCADRANRSPWYGDGRRDSWQRVSKG